MRAAVVRLRARRRTRAGRSTSSSVNQLTSVGAVMDIKAMYFCGSDRVNSFSVNSFSFFAAN
jgi:hypothetical protein